MLAIEGSSANDVWSDAWDAINAASTRRLHPRGDSSEVLHAALQLHDPRRRWVSARQPVINPAFALAEVVWMVRGRADARFLTNWNSTLANYSGTSASLEGAYGERLRHRFDVDQLSRAGSTLINNPESRQVVLQVWDARTDLPFEDGLPRSQDVPCNVVSLLKVDDGRLDWTQVMRSNDLCRGLPYNLVQWTMLQEIVAGWVGVEVGKYVHFSDSLHIYDSDRAVFRAEPTTTPPSPDLRLDRTRSDVVFAELEAAFERLSEARVPSDVDALTRVEDLGPYSDWLKVMAGERLRRLGALEAAAELLAGVKDGALRNVAIQWLNQRSGARVG